MTRTLQDIHYTSDGITPMMRCPWCGYADVLNEFHEYRHPREVMDSSGTGSTQCGQCWAAGHTYLFILAYDDQAPLYEDELFRDAFVSDLRLVREDATGEEHK